MPNQCVISNVIRTQSTAPKNLSQFENQRSAADSRFVDQFVRTENSKRCESIERTPRLSTSWRITQNGYAITLFHGRGGSGAAVIAVSIEPIGTAARVGVRRSPATGEHAPSAFISFVRWRFERAEASRDYHESGETSRSWSILLGWRVVKGSAWRGQARLAEDRNRWGEACAGAISRR